MEAYYFWAVDVQSCLSSVPFYSDPALRFLEYYNTTLQFQSTLDFLKTPPRVYQQPAIDVADILHSIETNVTVGYYQNQYEFEVDLQKLVLAIPDAHVYLNIGVTTPFVYGSPYSISSVSIDGKEPPKAYLAGKMTFIVALHTRFPIHLLTKCYQMTSSRLSQMAGPGPLLRYHRSTAKTWSSI